MAQNQVQHATRMNFAAESTLGESYIRPFLHSGFPKTADIYVVADGTTVYHPVHASHTGILLNSINQGVEPYRRVGTRITMDSIRVVGDIKFNSEPSILGAFHGMPIRVSLVYDKWPKDPTVVEGFHQVFETAPDGVSPWTNLYSMVILAESSRFNVLYDSVMTLSPPTFNGGINSGTGYPWGDTQSYHHVDMDIDLMGLPVSYRSGTNLPTSGALILFVTCGNASAVATGPSVEFESWSARLQFRDQ